VSVINLPSEALDAHGASSVTTKPTYFISDLHLDPTRTDTLTLSVRFFAHAQGAQAVFIIGDLFECELSASGTSIHLMHGNRDFLIGEDFAERVGAQLHRHDHLEVDFGTARYSLLHGDTLCTDDEQYQQIRQVVRGEQWQQEFLALSIDERIAKAQAFREESRSVSAPAVRQSSAHSRTHAQTFRSHAKHLGVANTTACGTGRLEKRSRHDCTLQWRKLVV